MIPDPPASVPANNAPVDPRKIVDFSFPPKPILKLKRCWVRAMHPYDAQSTVHTANNLNVSEYMSYAFPSPYTLQAAYTWINMNLASPIQHNWVLTLPPTDETQKINGAPEFDMPHSVIGGIGIKPGSDILCKTGEIGYWLAESYWGKGIITEVLGAFTDWVWVAYPDYVRLHAIVMGGNEGSCKALERAGYIKESVNRQAVCMRNGKIVDTITYRLCRDEWEENRKRDG